MSSPASRIVIIGAGIGGLTLALLLRRRDIIAGILEQAPELREVGAAVALAANGTRVLQHLDLGDGLAQASSEFTEIIHRDGRDGSRIAAHVMGRQYREAFGAPMFGLDRIALRSCWPARGEPGTCAGLPERLAWIHGYDMPPKALAIAVRDVDEDGKGTMSGRYHAVVPA